jgi:hypothetical protein
VKIISELEMVKLVLYIEDIYGNLTCVIISDEEKPENIVYSLISKIIISFLRKRI